MYVPVLQEVITGFLYSLLILAFFQPTLDKIDSFYMMDHYAALVIIVSHVSLGLVAFSLDSWSTSRGDTAQALGTGVGAALATHVNYQLGLLLDPPLSTLPLTLPPISTSMVFLSLLRFLIGVAVLLITRMVMKAVTIPFLCRLFGLPSDNVRQARQHMKVELPYRYIVYSVVGFSCVCVVPLLFRILNLAWVFRANGHLLLICSPTWWRHMALGNMLLVLTQDKTLCFCMAETDLKDKYGDILYFLYCQ